MGAAFTTAAPAPSPKITAVPRSEKLSIRESTSAPMTSTVSARSLAMNESAIDSA